MIRFHTQIQTYSIEIISLLENMKKLHLEKSKCSFQLGAGGRTRTGTVSLPMDFESITSANSITPASVEERSYYTLSEEKNQDLGGGAIRFFLFPGYALLCGGISHHGGP